MDTFEAFDPRRIADRILGRGDLLTLVEKAEALYNEDEALALQQKMMENKFTLQDFLDQLQKIQRMGSITSLLGMIPGMSKLQQSGQLNNQDIEARIKKVEAILHSMTRDERARPKTLEKGVTAASRKQRIARGSAMQVRDVNELLDQYRQMQKMMDQLRKGKFPKIPGLPGF